MLVRAALNVTLTYGLGVLLPDGSSNVQVPLSVGALPVENFGIRHLRVLVMVSNSQIPLNGILSADVLPLLPPLPTLPDDRRDMLELLVAEDIPAVTLQAFEPRWRVTNTSSSLVTPPGAKVVGGDREMENDPPTSPRVTTGRTRIGTGMSRLLCVLVLARRRPLWLLSR